MSALLLPPVSDLVQIRHRLRVQRVQERLLAPVVVTPPLPTTRTTAYCARCGTAKTKRVKCRICLPSQDVIRPAGSQGRREAGLKRGAAALGIPLSEYRQHRENGEKWCTNHKRWQPTSEFDASPVTSDRLQSYCRYRGQEAQHDR